MIGLMLSAPLVSAAVKISKDIATARLGDEADAAPAPAHPPPAAPGPAAAPA